MKAKEIVIGVVGCLLVGGGFFMVAHNSASASHHSSIVIPSVTSSATSSPISAPTSAPLSIPPASSSPSPAPSLAPVSIPAGVQLFDYTHGDGYASPDAQGRKAIEAWFRAEAWRRYAIANGDTRILGVLDGGNPGVVDAELSKVLGAQTVAVAGGTPVTAVAIEALSNAQQSGFTESGARSDLSHGLLITRATPEIITSNGAAIETTTENSILPGSLIHDPTLGDIWVVEYRQNCVGDDPHASLLCTGQ